LLFLKFCSVVACVHTRWQSQGDMSLKPTIALTKILEFQKNIFTKQMQLSVYLSVTAQFVFSTLARE
jgi:hypothetical protein